MIQAVLFRRDADKLRFKPVDGMKINATGRITVYPQRGNYQIICSLLEEKGKGDLLEIDVTDLSGALSVQNTTKGCSYAVSHSLSSQDQAILQAGGKLSYCRDKLK